MNGFRDSVGPVLPVDDGGIISAKPIIEFLQALTEWEKANRNVCIIVVSAHGTEPTSTAMCGMKIVAVGTDANGNINIDELRKATKTHKDTLSALMVTYPSTHGVF